ESVGVVPDSLFEEPPATPASYATTYTHDQSRFGWTQNLEYSPWWKNLAMHLSGSSGTSEDVNRLGSRSTNGDIYGKLDWRAKRRLVLSLNGVHSMSSVADGVRESRSEQRRNALSLQSQYHVPTFWKAQLTLVGSTEFQRHYDLRGSRAQSDSSYASGRLDALYGRLQWPLARGVSFLGSGYGSRNRPTTTVSRLIRTPAGADSITELSGQRPEDNAFLSGTLTFERLRTTKFILEAKRSGINQVYFDLGQLNVEQYSNEGRYYHFRTEGAPRPGFAFNADAALRRTLKEYDLKNNLNALVTSRQLSGGLAYSSASTFAFLNFDLNRTRAEQQKTGNGITLTRVISTNFSQRVLKDFYVVGLGSATLSSYRYLFKPDPNDARRTFSPDDRDVASAFGSIGVRFHVTPRCSTAANFSISRTHNVAIDSLSSSGNIATTVYQLNGSIRLPLHRDLSIGQDYIVTATDRAFDYFEANDGLSRNFRIETTVADTLFPFAYLRVDHRYFFFDQGDFSPIEPGGPRLYGVTTEQAQQILEGTIGIRPIRGVTLLVKQSLADTENRDLVGGGRTGTDQWNLALGLEVNRTFWNGAGLTGAIRREERYQNVSNKIGSVEEENHWLASMTFNKAF
ncbi:MAG TPA: hypothetical protein VI198_01995, partial [Candidatus Eisenbacteria bacterium]